MDDHPRIKLSVAAKVAALDFLIEDGVIQNPDQYIRMLNADIWYLGTESILEEVD